MVRKLVLLSIVMLSMMAISSCCNDSKMAALLEHVPDNADVVVVGDIHAILESAGGSITDDGKIKLPSYILDQLPSSTSDEFDELNSFLKKSGIDTDACALVGNYKDSRPVFIFALSDKKKFTAAIEDEGFKEKDDEDGVVYYSKKVYESSYSSEYDDYSYIAVKGSYAYWIERVWVGSDFKPVKFIRRLIEDASEAPFSKTSLCDYITSGNAAGASFRIPRELRQNLKQAGVSSSVTDMFDGVVCMKGSLENDRMTVDVKWFNEEGGAKDLKDFEDVIDLKATISGDALKYLGENECFVVASSIKGFDWDKYTDLAAETAGLSRSDRAALPVIKSYLEKIDGTIAFGFGLTGGLESIFSLGTGKDPFSQFACTMVIETKDGKAKSLMKDLKSLMESAGIPFDGNQKGFTIDIPGEYATFYAEAQDNYIILSNHKILARNDNATVKSFNFTDYIYAAAFSMDKSNRLFKDLDIKNDILLTAATDAKNFETKLKLEIKGGNSDGIIAKAAKIILDIASQEKSIDSKYRQYRDEAEMYDDYDEIVEAVVEEVEADSTYAATDSIW